MNTRTIKFSFIACLLFLLVAGTGVASAYSISAHADEKQLEIIKEIYGQEMTEGEYWATVYPEEYAKLKENLSPEEFEDFSNMEKYWGDDHPELPYGANVWDEKGPVSLTSFTDEEKSRFGLEDLKTDKSGYVIQGLDNPEYLLGKLSSVLKSKGGLELYAYDLQNLGSSIRYRGSGKVIGGTVSTTLSLTVGLYGDGSLVDSVSNSWTGVGESTKSLIDTFNYPQTGTLYQSKVTGSSSNPSYSGFTWSPGRLWPF
ncbi:hypothetical protein L1994_00575 [Methanomicrobium antiquum]|uniref:Uncharacterized protein n=1 Tax=Methanomicrobium antiquum TaxID=487686 RepID=A0AAF0JMZ2_9EURY|nr:hypothetical protein [Methanomicrobium antiquum]MDD3978416.1 hypothetical protein [Methanomicrobium sp.]WFN36926.1 hypothetical protein L1994_00575 [Methanomicrobium antiquum]